MISEQRGIRVGWTNWIFHSTTQQKIDGLKNTMLYYSITIICPVISSAWECSLKSQPVPSTLTVLSHSRGEKKVYAGALALIKV